MLISWNGYSCSEGNTGGSSICADQTFVCCLFSSKTEHSTTGRRVLQTRVEETNLANSCPLIGTRYNKAASSLFHHHSSSSSWVCITTIIIITITIELIKRFFFQWCTYQAFDMYQGGFVNSRLLPLHSKHCSDDYYPYERMGNPCQIVLNFLLRLRHQQLKT